MEWNDDVDRCPKSYFTEEVEEVICWYRDWKRFGALPYDGDALDQPVYVHNALNLCIDAFAKAEEDKIERMRLEDSRG